MSWGNGDLWGEGGFTLFGTLTSDRQARSAHGLTLISDRQARSAHDLTFLSPRQARSGHGWLISDRQARSEHPIEFISDRQARSTQYSKPFNDFWVIGPGGGSAVPYPATLTSIKYTDTGGTTLTIPREQVRSWTFSQPRNEPARWSVVFQDRDCLFAPDQTTGPWAGKLDSNPLDANFNLARYWQICVDAGGTPWNSPWLLQTDYQYDGTPDAALVTISGTDMSEMLLRGDQVMDEVRSTPSQLRYAHEVLAEILANYKIDSFQFGFEDYPIQQLVRVGTPMDWVRQILAVRQSWYRFSGPTFLATRTEFSTTGPANWEMLDRKNLKVLSVRRNLDPVRNQVTVQRVEANSGVTCKLGPLFGGTNVYKQHACTFPDPGVFSSTARVVTSRRGTVQNFVYDDEMGVPINNLGPATGGVFLTGGKVAKQVRFEVAPPPDDFPWENDQWNGPNGIYTPELEILFTGAPAVQQAPFGDFDAEFDVTKKDDSDQALHGPLPLENPIVDPLIPNKEVAEDFACQWLIEAVRTFETTRVSSVMNPLIKPGDTLRISDFRSKITDKNYFVETVTLNQDGTSATMDIELSRPAE